MSDAWAIHTGDNLPWLRSLPAGSAALCLFSPPYEAARTYGVGFNLTGQAWVDWLTVRIVEMCRVTEGLVLCNAAGQVRDHSYSPVVEWLVADLTRRQGLVCGPAPYVYFRFGVPGSGGKRYHRRDWEPVYAFCRPDVLPLRWTDNVAEGHQPKYATGGDMTSRRPDGARRDAFGCSASSSRRRIGSGRVEKMGDRKVVTRQREGRHSQQSATHGQPAVANPGNVVRERYDAEEVRQLLEGLVTREIDHGDVLRCLVGGGAMGSRLAHENEAPYPERLAEFFVRSYCPPGGVVMDPFCGSGTTGAVAVRLGRRFLGCDLRASQVELASRRVAAETPDLFEGRLREGGGP